MANPTPGHPDSPVSTPRRCRIGAWLVAILLLGAPGQALAESGEPFVVNEPPPSVLPAPAVTVDEGRTVAVVRDPPHMESARGAARRDALAKRPARHAGTPARKEGWLARPNPSASPALSREPPASPLGALVHKAAAAEPGRAEAPPEAWRRAIASRYAAWVAVVLLIGVPLFGLFLRHVVGRREERDLARYD